MLLISVVFVVLMVVGMPVAFATGIAGFVFFITTAGHADVDRRAEDRHA